MAEHDEGLRSVLERGLYENGYAVDVAGDGQKALAVWDDEADALGSNTLDVHLARLRAKIAPSGAKIQAVRAQGYRILSP